MTGDPSPPPALTPRVHERGHAARLDRVLDLVAFASRPHPLSECLDELPRRFAAVFDADVCSIYLLEGEDLVMRGTAGFNQQALGSVRLAIGDGITGLAVEVVRPISLVAAGGHDHFHLFPELDEERFPVFLAVPIPGATLPLGAVVLQRRQQPAFDAADIELATALTAPIASVIERSKLVEALRAQQREVTSGTRRVTLSGRAAVRGTALGKAFAVGRPRAGRQRRRTESETRAALEQAIGQARRTLEEHGGHARRLGLDVEVFQSFATMLDDSRLRERVAELCFRGDSLTGALCSVGGEAARVAARTGDDFTIDRAGAMTELCEALAAMVSGTTQADIPRTAILLGEQLTVFDLLITARNKPGGVVLGAGQPTPMTQLVLELLAVPAVIDVAGLFSWVSDGDTLIVDAKHGLVRVNPNRAEIALLREQRRQAGG